MEKCRRLTPRQRFGAHSGIGGNDKKPQKTATTAKAKTGNTSHIRKSSKGRFAPLTRWPMKPASLDTILRTRQRRKRQFFVEKHGFFTNTDKNKSNRNDFQ